jgi:hypothetical protein
MRTVIGVITGTRRDKYEDLIAWIRPLAEVTNDSWEIIASPESEFPTRGSIFWPHAIGAKENMLIKFHAKENSVKKDGPDEYMAVDSQPAFEVIDLRAVGDCEQVRLALIHGIALAYLSSPKFLIRCADNAVVGPIALVSDSVGKVTLEKNNRARIPCYQLAEGDFLGITWDGETRTVLARSIPPTPYSYVDWDDDRLVMRRAIEAAAKLRGNGTNLSRQLIDDATVQLTQYGANASARLEAYRLKRAKRLADDTQQVASLAGEIFAGLRDHPSVVQEVQKFAQARRNEIQSTIEREYAAEQDALTRLRKEREEMEEALRTTSRELEATEAKLKEQVSETGTAIVSRIDEVLGNVPKLLANVALLKPFLESRTSQNRGTWTQEWPSATVKIADVKELKLRLIRMLRALGVVPTAYQPIHAAFKAGLVPVLSGARALKALEAYGHVMCARRVLIVEVTSAIADVQDIFGKLGDRTFLPHPAGLIDVVRAARENEGPFLIVLNGINRGPTESYLLPLIRSLRNRTASIPLFHPQAIDPSDPYRSEARVQWPANLLLAATVIEGPTTLPVAPDVWNESILAVAETDGDFTGPIELGELSEVDSSSSLLDSAPASDHLDWISEELPWLHGLARRMAGALAPLITDQATLKTALTRSIVVPYLASIPDEEQRAGEIARLGKSFSSELAQWVNLARRSIA